MHIALCFRNAVGRFFFYLKTQPSSAENNCDFFRKTQSSLVRFSLSAWESVRASQSAFPLSIPRRSTAWFSRSGCVYEASRPAELYGLPNGTSVSRFLSAASPDSADKRPTSTSRGILDLCGKLKQTPLPLLFLLLDHANKVNYLPGASIRSREVCI